MFDGLRFTGSKGDVASELSSALRNELGFDTGEVWACTIGIGDGEGVSRDGGERAEGVVQDLQGLITSVGESRRNFEVGNTVDSRGT